MQTHEDNLIWIDLEMTGLDPERDRIIEIATVVTDRQLNLVAEGPAIAVHQRESRLADMDAWNTRQHEHSGLTARVRRSSVDESEAELITLTFLRRWTLPGASPMCGNSICQDRRFLVRYMPELAAYFHYRNLDVTALKILAQMWAPAVAQGVEKSSSHLALDDIHDSINELRYYREHLLRADIGELGGAARKRS